MKNIIYLCLALTAVLLLCIYLPVSKPNEKEIITESVTVSRSYTVSEYEGQVAVFTPDDELPVKVFDTAVSSLPEADRQLLKKGIVVNTPEDLRKIIEDFTG